MPVARCPSCCVEYTVPEGYTGSCPYCGKRIELRGSTDVNSRGGGRGRGGASQQACFSCGRIGHISQSCPQKKQVATTKCFKCGHPGHMARECPSLQQQPPSSFGFDRRPIPSHGHAGPVTVPAAPRAPRPTTLNEGGDLTRDKKRFYDGIVKQFVEDQTELLEFPSTLTPAERQHLHKLAMHYNLGHKSHGPPDNRVLRLTKDPSTTNHAPPGEQGPRFVKSVDMFQGVHRLGDVMLRDKIGSISKIATRCHVEMEKHITTAIRHSRQLLRSDQRNHGKPAPLISTKNAPSDTAISAGDLNELRRFRQQLPAAQHKDELIENVRKHSVVVVSGDTGCGKTTQVPQFLLDSKMFKSDEIIICTQPRRISAVSVATRVAKERGEPVGGTVGYTIRFESVTSRATRLVYVTTGILLRVMHSNPTLEGVAAVIVDEVHERDVDTDFALLLLKDIVQGKARRSNPLKVVVMSATINIEPLQRYFDKPSSLSGQEGPRRRRADEAVSAPPLVSIRGTLFPVREFFLEDAHAWLGLPRPTSQGIAQVKAAQAQRAAEVGGAAGNYEDVKAMAMARFSKDEGMIVPHDVIAGLIEWFHQKDRTERGRVDGAVLVFLPGWADIDRVMRLIQAKTHLAKELSVLPLHSSLSTAEQNRVFFPPPRGFRKVVLATNVAETSITIDDIVFVIDSCLHKGTNYDHTGNTSSLAAQLIAKANGHQRRGRAGRVRAGECVHLLTRDDYAALEAFLPPEMLRSPLEEVCLQLKAIAPDRDCARMLAQCLDPPHGASVEHAIRMLTDLGAFDHRERLTHLGRVLASMPVHPTLGKLLLFAASFGVLEPVSIIASSLGAKSPFMKPLPHQLNDARRAMEQLDDGRQSDHLCVLKLFTEWSKARNQADYAFQHFADNTQLRSMKRTQEQLARLVLSSGYLPRHVTLDWASRYRDNTELVRFCLAVGLSPRLAVVESQRKGRRFSVFCWDNKPADFHASSVVASSRIAREGREYVCYFERMRVESQLFIFDATALSRTAMILSSGSLLDVGLDEIEPAAAEDEECKFGPPSIDPSSRESDDETRVLVVGDGIKRIRVTPLEAKTLVQLQECAQFFFARAILHVNATLVPDDLVQGIAIALGEPARLVEAPRPPQRTTTEVEVEIELGAEAEALEQATSSGDDSPDDVEVEIEIIESVSAAEADLLSRAFGDIQWISRHLLREEAVQPVQKPTHSDAADDEDGDVVVFHTDPNA